MKKEINDVDEFNDYCCDALENFCESIQDDPRYIRPLDDEEKEEHYVTGFTFLYTRKGSQMIDRFIERMGKVGMKYYKEVEINISSHLYMEL